MLAATVLPISSCVHVQALLKYNTIPVVGPEGLSRVRFSDMQLPEPKEACMWGDPPIGNQALHPMASKLLSGAPPEFELLQECAEPSQEAPSPCHPPACNT